MKQAHVVEVEDISRLCWYRERILGGKDMESVQGFYLGLRERRDIPLPLAASLVPGKWKPAVLDRNPIFPVMEQQRKPTCWIIRPIVPAKELAVLHTMLTYLLVNNYESRSHSSARILIKSGRIAASSLYTCV